MLPKVSIMVVLGFSKIWGYSDALYRIVTKKNQFSGFCSVTVRHLFIEHVHLVSGFAVLLAVKVYNLVSF